MKNMFFTTVLSFALEFTAFAAGGVRIEKKLEGGLVTLDLVIPKAAAIQVAGRGFMMGLRVDPDGGTTATSEQFDFGKPANIRVWYGQVQNLDTDDPTDFYFDYVKGSCESGDCRYRASGIKSEELTYTGKDGKQHSHVGNFYCEILYGDNHEDAEAKAKHHLRDTEAQVCFSNITKLEWPSKGKTTDGRGADGLMLGG